MLMAGSLWLSGLVLGRIGWTLENRDTVEILMKSDPTGAWVVFDPIGLLVRPGQRIRWTNTGDNVHTTTAYHPSNDRHPLRIPAAAAPWDSGYLLNSGDSYEVDLTVEGIYDYYCKPHEAAGMVGRIIVTEDIGVHTNTFEPYPDEPENPGWKKISQAALRQFPSPKAILESGRIES